jgi:hypothetical protein
MAITWGIAWSIAGAIVTVVMGSLRLQGRADLPLLQAEPLLAATIFGIIGFLNGIGFSIALAASERRRSFNELAPSRIALWGVLGGVSYPAVFALSRIVDGFRLPVDFIVAIPLCAAFGALSAWSILTIAKRAKDRDQSQLGAGSPLDVPAGSRERATSHIR